MGEDNLINLIKQGYLSYVFQIIHRAEKKSEVMKLANGILQLYNDNWNANSLYFAVKTLLEVDTNQLEPIFLVDLYSHLSLAFERLGFDDDAKHYQILADQSRFRTVKS
ncbi:MAG: hypothetical protein INQ03_09080 [Candidatus Heimdallarchaeota archaeon]|nr:hypothetical protein [Candidatus Heimdallarchaeota archaeon]